MTRFADKVARVTGATSGIGAAAVLWLCSAEAAFSVGPAMVVEGGQTG